VWWGRLFSATLFMSSAGFRTMHLGISWRGRDHSTQHLTREVAAAWVYRGCTQVTMNLPSRRRVHSKCNCGAELISSFEILRHRCEFNPVSRRTRGQDRKKRRRRGQVPGPGETESSPLLGGSAQLCEDLGHEDESDCGVMEGCDPEEEPDVCCSAVSDIEWEAWEFFPKVRTFRRLNHFTFGRVGPWEGRP